ncbi:MAG TPA: nickel-dependent lactate racemase [Candidatus Hydrogenedentes bacterium]|nr:nickel-dependent lactate racemase [Candidatus Hydrogenedentota bacterium]
MPYGEGLVQAPMPHGQPLGTIEIQEAPPLPRVVEAIRKAINNPIGSDRGLFDLVNPGERITILVSDEFRLTGAEHVVPVLVNGLNEAGIPDAAIRIVFATGAHRPPTESEQTRILGEVMWNRLRSQLHVHDPRDRANLAYVGSTSRGTPVELNRRALDCDRLVATGAVVLHYFAGFGGGRKSIVPGIASIETIAHNHAMNLDPYQDRLNPAVQIGALNGNPVAEDMLEAARLIRVDFIVNTVLDRHGRIAAAFAGELDAAHRAAAQCARERFAVAIRGKADLVIASAGPAKNFVQSHKALFNAYQAVKPDGRIVFLAQCQEGLGGEQFTQWLRLGSPEHIFAELRKHSEINGQTALSTLQKTPITDMVTDLCDADVELLGARKAHSLAQAIARALDALTAAGQTDPTYYLMPSACYTVPFPT